MPLAGRSFGIARHWHLGAEHNRRSFLVFAGDAMEHFQRYKRSFGVLMIDIDRFKDVNDMHGHGAGDVVIQHVASVIGLAVRPTDKVARVARQSG